VQRLSVIKTTFTVKRALR